jgi:hypothetical protein
MSEAQPNNIAFYDKERKGIFIHAQLLQNGPFRPGDRFTVRPRPTQLFSVTLIKNDNGDIFYDKHGIFDKYVVTIEQDEPGTLKVRPLDVILDTSQRWY